MNSAFPAVNQVQVFLSRCSSIKNDQSYAYRSLLTESEWQRNRRYRFERDRHRDLIARALTRCILGEALGIAAAKVPIVADKKGKLWISPQTSNDPLQFNLSHSGDWIVLVLSRDTVGVDVEYTQRTNDVLAIANHYFFGDEIAELFAYPEAEQQARFFDYWTLKEAYMKARGEGISLGLSNFGFRLKDGIQLHIEPVIDDDPDNWQFRCLSPETDYRLSIAVNSPVQQMFSFSEIIPLQSKINLNWGD